MNKLNKIKEELTSGKNISVWVDTHQPIRFAPLAENLETDVVIVGGGIAGVSIAYRLSESGKKVVLIEDGYIGSGETGRTSAHLVTALDDRYYKLENIFGEENTRLAYESHRAAIDFIERTVKKEKIDCGFTRLDGFLFLHPSDKKDSLKKEQEAAVKAGCEVYQSEKTPGLKVDVGSCLQFKNQAEFHPLFYIEGLCKAIIRMGGKIYTETRAQEIDDEGVATEKGFQIKAKHIVVATHSPVNNKYVMHLKQYPYRTYVVGAKIKKNSLPKALWWDTGDVDSNPNMPPYHYIRTMNYNDQHDLLICGGEDHPTGLADADGVTEENRYTQLEAWMRKHFEAEDIIYKWSGQIMESMDSLAYIGRNPYDSNNVYIVTSDSGTGMTHGTIAGLLITDLINEKENEWEKLYSPSRFKIFKTGKIFFQEFVGGFMNYLKTLPKNADAQKLHSIKPGEGKIIELNGEMLGAYCDENNTMHFVAAECTHLQCIVKWNNDEKSWDCPCHGSRFTYDGKVINGPANDELNYYSSSTTGHKNS